MCPISGKSFDIPWRRLIWGLRTLGPRWSSCCNTFQSFADDAATFISDPVKWPISTSLTHELCPGKDVRPTVVSSPFAPSSSSWFGATGRHETHIDVSNTGCQKNEKSAEAEHRTPLNTSSLRLGSVGLLPKVSRMRSNSWEVGPKKD